MGKSIPVRSLDPNYANKLSVRIDRQSQLTDSGCIEWQGTRDRCGYGKINILEYGVRRCTGAHRAAWLAKRGRIDGYLQIDHLCRNTLCVNVDHMELVTASENTLRADHSNKRGASGVKKREFICVTHRDERVKSYWDKLGYEHRYCMDCRKDYMREYMRNYKKN